jgi:hypothetical protein
MPDLRERWRISFVEATTYDWAGIASAQTDSSQ